MFAHMPVKGVIRSYFEALLAFSCLGGDDVVYRDRLGKNLCVISFFAVGKAGVV